MADSARLVSYAALASEYYDSLLHPTCANFREASKVLIGNYLEELDWQGMASFVEVGAGKSVVAEIFQERGYPMGRLTITDVSSEMLGHSNRFKELGASLLVADAANLSLPDSSVDLLISSLGDPYNTPLFWREVSRILTPGGYSIFSTPSHAWSSRFRRGVEKQYAKFQMTNGDHVLVPSSIKIRQAQVQMIELCDLEVIGSIGFMRSQLNSTSSYKLACADDGDLPIVEAYILKRSQEL